MIYIYKDGNVVYDGSTLSQKEKDEAILVAERPVMENKDNRIATLRWDIETGRVWYDYETLPTIPDYNGDQIEDLQQSIAELTMAMAMMMGGI